MSADMPVAQTDKAKLALAAEQKNKANAAFAVGKYSEAATAFSLAIALDPTNPTLYSNRAAAYTALGKKDRILLGKAVTDAQMATKLDPSFMKGYARQATALTMLGRHQEAIETYTAGLAKDPASKILLEGLAAAQKAIADKAKADQTIAEDLAAGIEVKEGEVVIGIDLGTTYSCVGVWQGKNVTMIPNERGSLTSPSWVCFSDTGKRYVGQAAKNMAARFPTNTIYDVKRIIGQKFDDEGVSSDVDKMPYKIVASNPGLNGQRGTGKPMIQVDWGMHGKKLFAPEEISGMVLGYLKKTAETFLGHAVTKAVITVPAYFNDSQRAATKAAGKIAGLDVLRIINEPTAAALSYGLDRRHKDKPANVLIFDLGGGTFDVSVLNIDGGVTQVMATGGDTRLGGEDFDITVSRFLAQEAVSQGMPDISKDPRATRRLQNAVEQAKRQLSQSAEAQIHVEALFTLDTKVKGTANYKTADFNYTLTRAKFESLNMTYFNKCLETVKKVLKDAKLKPSEIDDIVLVGGSTRIPKMQEMLQEYFGGKELCRSLNPDEAVAYGAAVQGAILNNARDTATSGLLLMDVTPLSLGIETTGRVMSVIIPRNTQIPCIKTQTYTTEENYQTEIDVCVYEGERSRTDENNLLGKFTISGIERAKRGVPKIDVSFSLDSNGILQVTARDMTTGAEARIEIERSGRSSDADIERMVRDAERYRQEDEEAIKRIEAFNDLEALVQEAKQLSGSMTEVKKAEQIDKLTEEIEAFAQAHEEDAKVAEIKLKRRQLETLIAKLTKMWADCHNVVS